MSSLIGQIRNSMVGLGARKALGNHKSATFIALAIISLLIAYTTNGHFRHNITLTNLKVEKTFAHSFYKVAIPLFLSSGLLLFVRFILNKLGQGTPEGMKRRIHTLFQRIEAAEKLSEEFSERLKEKRREIEDLSAQKKLLKKELKKLKKELEVELPEINSPKQVVSRETFDKMIAYRTNEIQCDQIDQQILFLNMDRQLLTERRDSIDSLLHSLDYQLEALKKSVAVHLPPTEQFSNPTLQKKPQVSDESPEKRKPIKQVRFENEDPLEELEIVIPLTIDELKALNEYRTNGGHRPLTSVLTEKERAVCNAWKAYYPARLHQEKEDRRLRFSEIEETALLKATSHLFDLKTAFDRATIQLELEDLKV